MYHLRRISLFGGLLLMTLGISGPSLACDSPSGPVKFCQNEGEACSDRSDCCSGLRCTRPLNAFGVGICG